MTYGWPLFSRTVVFQQYEVLIFAPDWVLGRLKTPTDANIKLISLKLRRTRSLLPPIIILCWKWLLKLEIFEIRCPMSIILNNAMGKITITQLRYLTKTIAEKISPNSKWFGKVPWMPLQRFNVLSSKVTKMGNILGIECPKINRPFTKKEGKVIACKPWHETETLALIRPE